MSIGNKVQGTAGLVAAVVLATCAARAAESGAVLEIPMQMHASYFSEHCVDFPAGRELGFEVEARHPVDFNIHRHTAAATEYPVKRLIEHSYSGSLRLAGGEYCFMWTNPAARPGDFTVTLRYSVSEP